MMKRINTLVPLLWTLVLAACSSKPVQQAHYYLLNTPDASTQQPRVSDKPRITLRDIKLAGYLRQNNLVMLLDDHSLYFSRKHLWANELEHGLTYALLADLNSSTSTYQFVAANNPLASDSIGELLIEFEHFIPTHDATVLVKGTYWHKLQGQEKWHSAPFDFSLPLSEDGYPHAVKKLREVLRNVANAVHESLSTP